MPIIEMTVTGMTCGHCARSVTDAIHLKDAAARVAVDLPTGLLSVETKLSRPEVITAVEGQGYKVA